MSGSRTCLIITGIPNYQEQIFFSSDVVTKLRPSSRNVIELIPPVCSASYFKVCLLSQVSY